MTQLDKDWRRAAQSDPRVAELARLANDAVRIGGHDPEVVYQDANRHLESLLGLRRGTPPRSRNEPPAPYEAQFAAAVTAPFNGNAADEGWLGQDRVFTLCCGQLNDIVHQEVAFP